MKKTSYSIFALALLVCSCTDKISITDASPAKIEYSFRASSADRTRSSYYGTGTVIWNMNDKLSVLDGYGNNQFCTYDEGEEVVFSGIISAKAKKLVAIYPYSEGNRLASDGEAVAVFPGIQNAVQGGFCAGANPSFGVTTAGSGETVTMQNLGAYLKFTIPEGTPVSAVFLESNGEESLSGPIYVTYGAGDPVTATKGGQNFVCLLPRDGYTFASGTYYAVVNPVTLSSGLKFIARRPDGRIGIKSGSTSNTLVRNKTKNLGEIDLGSMSWQQNSLYANDTISLDFTGQPFVEPLRTTKDSGIVEYHTPRGDTFIFRVDTVRKSRNTRGPGWCLSSTKGGYLQFYPNTYSENFDERIIDGIQCPAFPDKRLKKVMLTTGNNSFKAMVYNLEGELVTGGKDTDSTHFNPNGNWKGGITAEFELVGTKPGTSYNLVSATKSSFINIQKLVYIYEKTLPTVSVDSLSGVGIVNLYDSGTEFQW